MCSRSNQQKRPRIILSAAITLDGRIASVSGDVTLSNTEDWKRVHHLRARSDAIMVGSGTILSDDSKLTVKAEFFEEGYNIQDPIRIVVSSRGKIPLNARVITYRPDVRTIIAITTQCPTIQKEKLIQKGCNLIICGEGPLVNLKFLMETLYKEFNIKSLLLEGGSKLNGNMLTEELIDEIHLAIAPVLGGEGTPIFTLPTPIKAFTQSPFFEIMENQIIGDMIWLKLKVHYKSRKAQ